MKMLRYNATLNQVTGDPLSTLVMLQLEYWFEIMENRVFYKYLEPCGAVQYKQGDSWTEELGISKATFRTAFGRIGKVYKSVRAYEESEDKFEGKMYLAYVDRMRGLTFYVRNTALVEKMLSEIEHLESEHTEVKRDNSPEVNGMNSLRVEEDNLREPSSTSYVSQQADVPISLDNYKDNNNRLQTAKTGKVNRQGIDYEQCIKDYHTICPDLYPVVKVSDRLRERLTHLFVKCEVTMQQFKQMLVKVHESDFLSGRSEANAWKANLEWMVKEDKFWGILEGGYQEFTKPKIPNKHRRFTEISSHNWDFDKLEELEARYIEENALDPIVANSPLMKKLYESRAEQIQLLHCNL